MADTLHFTVESLKVRLDKYLAQTLPDKSRSSIVRDIENGCVAVNGHASLEAKTVVRVGDEITYTFSEPKQAAIAKNLPLKTLYNNHGLLIIDKPPGISVHPGAGIKADSLVSALLYHFPDIHIVGEDHRPGIVHRLDKDTSGVMLIALTQEMYEYLKDAFADRKVKKEYIALVAGKLGNPHGIIDTPIGKSKKDFRKQTTIDPVQAKAAVTEYQVLESLDPSTALGVKADAGRSLDNYTLIRVLLHTGRTHQIRVHFASLGHPLAGDSLYGTKNAQAALFPRQFLHAAKIEVRLPDKTWIEADSPLPPDLKKVLEALGSKKFNQI